MPRYLRCVAVAGLFLSCSLAWAAFPKLEPEKAFPALKVYDPSGRPWRVPQEDWKGAADRVKADPAWAKWLAGERGQVDRWSARHQDRVAWVCGWWHDFISPKDGSYLTWTDEIPGETVSFLHSPSDPHVEITPKIFGGWVFGFRGRNAEMIRRSARLYRLTGEERYADWAAGQIDFYAAHLQEWPVSSRGARLYWQTLDEATNTILYADAVRLLGDHITPERRQRWHDQLFVPTVALLDRTMLTIHNIATWHRCASAEVALVFNDTAMWHQALDGPFGIHRQIAEGVTSDYLWYEQSFGYNAYVVRALLTLFTAAGLQGHASELAPEMSVAENLMLSPLYLRMPDGYTPNPADSTGRPSAPDRTVYSDVYRVFPTTLGLEVAATRRDWDTLLDPPVASPRPVALPEPKAWNLESSRMARLQAGPWNVFFHYGQLTRSHAQAEALNFTAYYEMTDVTHDPGTVGYGSPLHQRYYTKGLNHNVPLIDGEGEEPPQAGELIEYSADPVRVIAQQPHYRKHASARRELTIVDQALRDTTTIETSDGPHRLGLSFHVQGHVSLPTNFAPDPNFARDRPPAFAYWQEVTGATFQEHAAIEVTYPSGKKLRVEFSAPGEFRLWHASTPDAPPQRREGFYLELTTPSAKATFVTSLAPT